MSGQGRRDEDASGKKVPPPLDERHPVLLHLVLPWARALARYHRMELLNGPAPRGACIYVAHHGAGYLNHDLVLACYLLQWQGYFERGEPYTPLRIVAADSRIERYLPGLPRMKEIGGPSGPPRRLAFRCSNGGSSSS